MQNNKSLLMVIIICSTILLSAIFLSRTGIYIKNTGGVESGGKISNTISVSGDGKVSVKPDMVSLSIGFQETASTSKGALDKLNEKIDSVVEILKNNNIPESDITTSNLNLYTEYDYSGSYRRIIGQRATQNLEVKIKKIDAKASRATKIIDELSSVERLQINGISFDIENKTELFTKAREMAFNKARQKAEELAKFSKVKLTKPISISDSTYDVSPVRLMSNMAEFKQLNSGIADESQIMSGEMSVSANLSILWGIE